MLKSDCDGIPTHHAFVVARTHHAFVVARTQTVSPIIFIFTGDHTKMNNMQPSNILPLNQQLYSRLNTGALMPLLGLGCWDMYGAEATQAVEWALQTGYRLIDTASMYQNEREVGQAIRHSGVARADIFLTTKLNNTDQGDADVVRRAFDRSLQLLDCEYVDLYLIHWPIRHKRRESWVAIEQLYHEGLVKGIGVSNYLLPFLHELEGYSAVVPAVNQIEFSPYLYLQEELQHCREKGIQLQGYSPVARGAKFKDSKLVQLAEKYGKSPAQMMIRWQLEHGVSVIPKSSNLQRLQENFAVFDFEIAPEDVAFMDGFHSGFRVVEDPMDIF